MRRRSRKWLLVAPAVVPLVFLGVVTFAYAIYISLYEWPKIPTMAWEFVGARNYLEAFTDSNFRYSLILTFKFVGVGVPLQFVAGMSIALALKHLGNIGKKFVPVLLCGTMLSAVSVGIMWYLIFGYRYGPISHILELLGQQRIDFLGTRRGAFWSIVIAESWWATPFVMVLLYAGLIGLPQDVYEAAMIDGASARQVFFSITLPLLKPIIVVLLALRLTDAIKMFGLVRGLTQGGPGNATEVVSYYIYNQGFSYWNLSYAAVLTLVLLVIIVVIFIVYTQIAMRERIEL